MKLSIKLAVKFCVLLLYTGFIFYLSSRTWDGPSNLPPYADKVIHFGLYFILGVISIWSFDEVINKRSMLLIVSVFFVALYGASDEFHQSFIPGRFADIYDWVSDLVGGGVGVFMFYLLKWRSKDVCEA